MDIKEIVIEQDGVKKTVQLRPPKGKHTKEGLNLLLGLETKDGVNPAALKAYTEYLDCMAAELSGITVEELDNLEESEKNKIIGYYNEAVKNKITFLTSSLKQEN